MKNNRLYVAAIFLAILWAVLFFVFNCTFWVHTVLIFAFLFALLQWFINAVNTFYDN